jgi:hypothetical protein
MGCTASSAAIRSDLINGVTIDDSIQFMLERDRKNATRMGLQAPSGYRPRAPHPRLQAHYKSTNDDDTNVVSSDNSSKHDHEVLLELDETVEDNGTFFETKHHDGKIDFLGVDHSGRCTSATKQSPSGSFAPLPEMSLAA